MANPTVSAISFNNAELVDLLKKANTAAESVGKACRNVAAYLVSEQNTGAPAKVEHPRLMALAGAAIAEAKIVLKHERNVLMFVAQSLWIEMCPDAEIETGTQGKGDKKSRTLKPAAQCKTSREVAAAAKQIREMEGAADKRASNAPAKKAVAVTGILPAQVAAALKAHSKDVAGIIKALRDAGYKVTAPKADTIGEALAKTATA